MKNNHFLASIRNSCIGLLAAFGALVTSVSGASFYDAAGVGSVTLGTARGGTQTLGGVSLWNWAAFSFGNLTVSNSVDLRGSGWVDIWGDVGTLGNFAITKGKARNLAILTGKIKTVTTSTIGTAYQNATWDAVLNTAKANAITANSNASNPSLTPNSPSTSLTITKGVTPTTYAVGTGGATATAASYIATINSTNLAVSLGVAGAANTTYVIRLQDLILSGTSAVLTLSGANTTNYIINVRGSMALSSGASIVLSGGLQPQNVLFNLWDNATYNATNVTLSGASTVNGIILAPSRTVTLAGGSKVLGQVIANVISLTGNSQIKNPLVSPF